MKMRTAQYMTLIAVTSVSTSASATSDFHYITSGSLARDTCLISGCPESQILPQQFGFKFSPAPLTYPMPTLSNLGVFAQGPTFKVSASLSTDRRRQGWFWRSSASNVQTSVYVRGPIGTPYTMSLAGTGFASADQRGTSGASAAILGLNGAQISVASAPLSTNSISNSVAYVDGLTTAPVRLVDGVEYSLARNVSFGASVWSAESCFSFCDPIFYQGIVDSVFAVRTARNEDCCPAGLDQRQEIWQNPTLRCYQYATNNQAPPFGPAGIRRSTTEFLDAQILKDALLNDGIWQSSSASCPSGSCLVFAWVRPGRTSRGADFHFFRLNRDGRWTHKPGDGPPVVINESQQDYQSRTAYQPVGYFCVPCALQVNRQVSLPSQVATDRFRVTPLALLGVDEPSIDVGDGPLLQSIRGSLGAGVAPEPAPQGVDFGYRGFRIEVGSDLGVVPSVLVVRDSKIIFRRNGQDWAVPDTGGAEQTLRQLADSLGWRCLIQQRCSADSDCDGSLTVNDVFEFISLWFAGVSDANIDGMPGVDIPDLFMFLQQWFEGCV